MDVRVENLYRAEGRRILAYLAKRVDEPEDAADLLAEVFVVAWRRRHVLPSGDGGRLWLYGVARRTLANHRRGDQRRAAATRELAAALAQWGAAHPPDEATTAVRQALARLPERDREIITLVEWDGLSPSEAAQVVGVLPSSARSRLQRARARLASELRDVDEFGSQRIRTVPAALAEPP